MCMPTCPSRRGPMRSQRSTASAADCGAGRGSGTRRRSLIIVAAPCACRPRGFAPRFTRRGVETGEARPPLLGHRAPSPGPIVPPALPSALNGEPPARSRAALGPWRESLGSRPWGSGGGARIAVDAEAEDRAELAVLTGSRNARQNMSRRPEPPPDDGLGKSHAPERQEPRPWRGTLRFMQQCVAGLQHDGTRPPRKPPHLILNGDALHAHPKGMACPTLLVSCSASSRPRPPGPSPGPFAPLPRQPLAAACSDRSSPRPP
jgi:hypothetical protein